jgi:hypothetical protein
MYVVDVPIRSGKPRSYETEHDLMVAIDDYFNKCDSRLKTFVGKDGEETTALVPEPYSIAGLRVHLGISNNTISEYKQLYGDAISYAYAKIEGDTVRRLLESSNQTGAIFYLKNAFGYRDQTEQTVTNKGEQTVIYRPEKLPEDAIEGEVVRDTRGITEQKSIEGK